MLESKTIQREIKEPKKGALTRALIIESALAIASKSGLEGLTIGNIADAVNMSKSGVFAHFGSREDLQVAVIKTYHENFESLIFTPALLKPKGLPRLKKLIDAWLKMSIGGDTSSCFFIAGAAEYDDRPGIVRDALVSSVQTWRAAILRSIKESIAAGHLKKSTNAEVMLFQLYSIVLGAHHDARFLDNPLCISTANKLIKEIFAQHQETK